MSMIMLQNVRSLYKIKSNYMYYLDKNKIIFIFILIFLTFLSFVVESYISCDFYFNITKWIFIVYYAVTCRGRRPSHLGCEGMYFYDIL